MALESYGKRFGIGKFLNISFGLITSLLLLWLVFNSFIFAGEGDLSVLNVITFLSYGILGVYVFANADIRNKLYNISFFKSLPRFFLFFGIALIGFYFLLGVSDPFPDTALNILKGVPTWILVIHAFVFATIESAFFQGYLDKKIGIFGSVVTAGLFHMLIWAGLPWQNFLGASALFLFFSSAHWYFRKNTDDLIPVIAIHTAYNFIKLAIILMVVM